MNDYETNNILLEIENELKEDDFDECGNCDKYDESFEDGKEEGREEGFLEGKEFIIEKIKDILEDWV